MGKLVYIMGKSGTGKSRSMRNIPAERFGLINPEGKDLPFGKDAPAFRVERVTVDDSSEIVDAIKTFSRKYSIIVVDDFQTVMTNEFMRRSAENGYQKWTDIGKHAWEVAEAAKGLPDDCILYVLCHTEENENGGEKIKTLGKLLDQNVVLESKSTIVLKTGVENGRYFFCTQNNGRDTVKSPEGMFPSYAVKNDLLYVDDAIRHYYDLTGARTDAEMMEEHAGSAEDIEKPAAGRKRRKKDVEEVLTDNQKKLEAYQEARDAALDAAAGDRDEVPFEEAAEAMDSVPAPDLEEVPKRKRQTRKVDDVDDLPFKETKEDDILNEDTYFFVPATGNYVMKHAGDRAPEGGQPISIKEYHEGVARIARGEKAEPLEENMNPPERTRRRRTRANG